MVRTAGSAGRVVGAYVDGQTGDPGAASLPEVQEESGFLIRI